MARENHRTALVVFGSETGNAEEIAVELGKLTERLHFFTKVTELNSVAPQHFAEYAIVLCAISTTGQGDLPANAQILWKKLRSTRLQSRSFAGVNFTSFGLGDSSYPKFNWAHRKLSNRMKQLGANIICDRGESDEQHPDGIDGTFLPWLASLRTALLDTFPLPKGLHPLEEGFLTPKWALEFESEALISNGSNENKSHAIENMVGRAIELPEAVPSVETSSTKLQATLVKNHRVTPESHWQDVRIFEFSTAPVNYIPGDILAINPMNELDDVDQLLTLMGWASIAERPMKFVPTDPNLPREYYPPPPVVVQQGFGQRLTLRTILTNHLDLSAIPRRSFFSSIAHFTEDEAQKERLIEFTDPELVDELYDYTTRPRRSVLEVLQEFDTVKIPLKWIASIFPRIRPRQFSIASGGELKRNPDGSGRIELLVAIVKYRTVIKRIRRGLCTTYLAGLQRGAKLDVQLCRGGMNLSFDRPAVMIGPGTGIAPLRSMIYERLQSPSPLSAPVGSILFFGGRNRSADFFFEHEWSDLQQRLPLAVFPAFSRDQNHKVYVQDIIRQQSHLVYSLLQNGVIYICGSSGKMPQAVREALIEVFEQHGEMSRDEAEAHFVQMEKSGRYQQETW